MLEKKVRKVRKMVMKKKTKVYLKRTHKSQLNSKRKKNIFFRIPLFHNGNTDRIKNDSNEGKIK